MLPDETGDPRREEMSRGEPPEDLGLGLAMSNKSIALSEIENNAVMNG